MDTIRLRKLSYKSIFDFGKHTHKSVGQVMELHKTYLTWIYYNCSNISFVDEILDDILSVSGEQLQRIEKPGIKPELYDIFINKIKSIPITEAYAKRILARSKALKRGRAATIYANINKISKKQYNQFKNQGH